MVPPVLCFSCGKVLSDKYEELQKIIIKRGLTSKDSLDSEFNRLGLTRICCRMHIISHLDYTEVVQ